MCTSSMKLYAAKEPQVIWSVSLRALSGLPALVFSSLLAFLNQNNPAASVHVNLNLGESLRHAYNIMNTFPLLPLGLFTANACGAC